MKKTKRLKNKCHNCHISFVKVENGKTRKDTLDRVIITWKVIGKCPKCGCEHGEAVKVEEIER